MATSPRDLVDQLRQPEYTGNNRCLPCTVVNVLIAVIVTSATTVLFVDLFELSILFLSGIIVFLVSLSIIYFRGYLVPGTPTFTMTFFPDWLLQRFDKERSTGETPLSEEGNIEVILKEMDAVTECDGQDDLCLTDDFRSGWKSRIHRHREDNTPPESFARVLGVDADSLTFTEYDEAFVASYEGSQIGRWESNAAFLADVAGAHELRRRDKGWSQLDVRQRSTILQRLRIFLQECPACGGAVSVNREITESCCRSLDVLVMGCEDCNARIFEAEQREG